MGAPGVARLKIRGHLPPSPIAPPLIIRHIVLIVVHRFTGPHVITVLVWFSFDFVHHAEIDNVIRPKRYLPFPFFLGFLIVLFCTAPD